MAADLRFPAGPRLGLARKAAGFSAEQMGLILGRGVDSIRSYECGRVEPPTHLVVKWARVLGVSLDELFREPVQK